MVKNSTTAAQTKESQETPQVANQATPQVAAQDSKTVDAGKVNTKEKPQVASGETPKPSEAAPIIDLAKDLSSPALREMREWIDSVIKQRAEGELIAARKKVEELAKGLGMSVQDLLGVKIGKSHQMSLKMPSTVPIKYRHPDDANLSWTGRGRSPQWVKDWLESHSGDDTGIKV